MKSDAHCVLPTPLSSYAAEYTLWNYSFNFRCWLVSTFLALLLTTITVSELLEAKIEKHYYKMACGFTPVSIFLLLQITGLQPLFTKPRRHEGCVSRNGSCEGHGNWALCKSLYNMLSFPKDSRSCVLLPPVPFKLNRKRDLYVWYWTTWHCFTEKPRHSLASGSLPTGVYGHAKFLGV